MGMGRTVLAALLTTGLVICLAGCREKTPGEKIGDAVDKAANATKKAANDVGNAVEDAGHKANKAIQDATK